MNKTNNSTYIISYLTLRKSVGFLGILLPIGLMLGTCLLSECKVYQPSISHYYYTSMGEYFVGTICAVALFLFCYKGYDRWDSFATNLAAVFALGIVAFPTAAGNATNMVECNTRTFVSGACKGDIHIASASLFFLTVALISMCLFTRSNLKKEERKARKNLRNTIYKTCGALIILCLAAIALYLWHFQHTCPALVTCHTEFWLEAVMLFSFGFSWLIKGGMFFRDK